VTNLYDIIYFIATDEFSCNVNPAEVIKHGKKIFEALGLKENMPKALRSVPQDGMETDASQTTLVSRSQTYNITCLFCEERGDSDIMV